MTTPAPAAAAPLPWWKRAVFMAATLAVPLLPLLLCEAALRLAGWGGYPPFLRPAGRLEDGRTVALVEPAASKPYFFANPTRPGYADETNFLMPKPDDTVRIFLVGESAAKGFPQPRNLSMSAFLEAMLGDLWPERKVEVINLGTTAAASFPLVFMTRDALRFDPDLFIFYVGNNEFFGAYGVASINAVGTLPAWSLPMVRWCRGLAMVQAVEWLVRRRADENRSLMEQMVGRTNIPADSPLRTAAAGNLSAHLGRMVELVTAAGLPAVVCTTASNESGLRPLGGDPEATGAFERGLQLAAAGDRAGARRAFLEARDLDTMPWRPTTAIEEAARAAATRKGAVLCDLAEVFRDRDPAGAPGWDLFDDHVHLSLQGQAEAARGMVAACAALPGLLRVDPDRAAGLPDWESYAARLGRNDLDDYRVHHTVRVLFNVPFMKESNPEAAERFTSACRRAEEAMPPDIASVVREWQSMRPHAGGLRPLTGMVARVMVRQRKLREAERLFSIAQRQVPDYTSWYLEYVYFALACRQELDGGLSPADDQLAADAIAQGRFLLRRGFSSTGMAERYVGRLHQLRGAWQESIGPLEAARARMRGTDLVACDQALIEAYRRTGDLDATRRIIAAGLDRGGPHQGIYRQLAEQLSRPEPLDRETPRP
jgi:hypothetical protein